MCMCVCGGGGVYVLGESVVTSLKVVLSVTHVRHSDVIAGETHRLTTFVFGWIGRAVSRNISLSVLWCRDDLPRVQPDLRGGGQGSPDEPVQPSGPAPAHCLLLRLHHSLLDHDQGQMGTVLGVTDIMVRYGKGCRSDMGHDQNQIGVMVEVVREP